MEEQDFSAFNPQIVHVHTGHFHAEKGSSHPDRMCMFYEIELITEGADGGVYTLDQFLPALPGTIYIRQPGMMVRGTGDYTYYAIIFDSCYDPACEDLYKMGIASLQSGADLSFLQRMQPHMLSFLDRLPPRITVRNPERYLSYFENAFHHTIDGRQSFQLYARRELYAILALLLRDLDGAPDSMGSAMVESLMGAKKFMDLHYAEHLDLEILASQCCLSREHFCRQFRRYFSFSPMEYLKSVRLFHARHLLITTDMTVSRIVEVCGFSSEQYFYQQFQKSTGISPSGFRRRALP